MLRLALALLFLLIPATVWAQGVPLQGGPGTPGRVPMYAFTGGSQPFLIDGGSAGGGAAGANISEMGITARGTGTPPYAGQGAGPNGENICDYDAPTTNATGYHVLCLSANALGGGLISYSAFGTATIEPLYVAINGNKVPLIQGPGTTVIGHFACWGDVLGATLTDCTGGGGGSGIVIGTTTVTGATSGNLLFASSGVVGQKSVTGSGNAVLATSPSVSGLTVTGSLTATGLVTNADLANASTTVNGTVCTLGSTCSPASGSPSGSAGGDLSGTYPSPTVAQVNGVAYGSSPSTNTAPVVTGSNTITYEAVPNAALAHSTMTIAGHSIALGATQAIACADLSNGATGCSTATGTSGGTLPLLNGVNTWASAQTFSAAPVLSTLTGPLIGNGASAVTAGTFSGNTTSVATTTGSLPAGDCVQFDASGNLADAGAACGGTGGGTVNSGVAGQMTYYATTGTAVSGNANATISTGSLTLGQGGSVQGNLKLANTTSGVTTISPTATSANTLSLPAASDTLAALGTAETWTANQSFNSGTVKLKGSSTGTLTVQPAAAAGTSTLVLPGGSTDFSATGGTHQVVQQASTGAALTVGQIACGDLSDASASCATNATNASNISSGTLSNARLASLSADSLLGNASASPSTPSGVALTSCSSANSALTYSTSGHAFGCNSTVTSITAGTGLSGGTITSTGTIALSTPVAVANGGTGVTASTGSTNLVLSNSPTLVTPVLGAATATSINFGGSTLGTYTEGTFTPGLTFGGGNTGLTTSQAQGTYTRIGDLVCFNINLVLTAKGSSSGAVLITGLPFTSKNDAVNAVPAFQANNLASISGDVAATVSVNSTQISPSYLGTGTATTMTDANFTNTSIIRTSGCYLTT